MQLVLSTFPGIGLLDAAFEAEGFCVVRGPDLLWGGDIKTFHPPAGRFDGIIGGSPCPAFSRLRHIVEANGYKTAENLIPEYERVVEEAAVDWFVHENAPDSPEPVVPGYAVSSFVLNNRHVGGAQDRKRRFSFGVRGGEPVQLRSFVELSALEPAEYEHAVVSSSRAVPVALLKGGKEKRTRKGDPRRSVGQMLQAQGFPPDLLDHAPFTETAKRKVVSNGVPRYMGRAVARAVREALARSESLAA